MGSATAIGVDDNLTSGKAGIAVGAADDEFTGRIDVEDVVVVKKVPEVVGKCGFDAGYKGATHVVADYCEHLLVGFSLGDAVGGDDEVVMLGGNDDCVNAHGPVEFVIFYCHLAF